MAKRRALKKTINNICGELFAEVIAAVIYANADREAANDITGAILNLQSDIISRISHTQPGNVKGFYKKLREDFNATATEIIDQICNLH
ncbi:MAG: hypothetical protein MJZ83_05435 [Bacteroidaceae bacterium]|nr:hypothetical protein [Bacteroidaceae bacterium]